MIPAQKWIEEKKEYIPYMAPDGAVTISANLHDKITCASCKKSLTYGESYCSLTIHTSDGWALGYCVCKDCHAKEIADALLYRD